MPHREGAAFPWCTGAVCEGTTEEEEEGMVAGVPDWMPLGVRWGVVQLEHPGARAVRGRMVASLRPRHRHRRRHRRSAVRTVAVAVPSEAQLRVPPAVRAPPPAAEPTSVG